MLGDRSKTIVALVLVGLGTGILTLLFQPFGGPLVDPIEDAVRASGARWLDGFVEIALTFGPGLVFGAGVGAVLHTALRRSWWRWLLLTAAGTGSWYAGILTAIKLFDTFDTEWIGLAFAGGIGGLAGGAILAVALLIAYPTARTMQRLAALVIVGGVVGTLLAVPFEDGPRVLFPVWQTVMAVLIGWAVGAVRPSRSGG